MKRSLKLVAAAIATLGVATSLTANAASPTRHRVDVDRAIALIKAIPRRRWRPSTTGSMPSMWFAMPTVACTCVSIAFIRACA